MRRLRALSTVLVATLFAACAHEGTTTGPSAAANDARPGVAGTQGGAGQSTGTTAAATPGTPVLKLVFALPDSLKLSADQQAKVKAAVDAYAAANKADADALATIMKNAEAAQKAGQSKDEVRKILDQAAPIQQRLAAADAALGTQILALLTAPQKAWVTAHLSAPKPPAPPPPVKCDPSRFPPLTADQQAKISALVTAFQTANKADLDAIAAAGAQAKAAQQAGKSKDEIQKILDAVKPAADRVAAAHAQLEQAVVALLTPEQKATGCVPLEMPKPPAAPGDQPGTKPAVPAGPDVPLPAVAGLVQKLPPDLALSADQKAKVKAAIDAYAAANRADIEALAAVMKSAEAAQKAGKSKDEVKQILDQAAPIRARLDVAQQALAAQLLALLTDAQKAWVAAHTPKVCDPSKFPPLSADQQAKIAALVTAFQTANKADLDAIAAAGAQAKAAQQAGKSKDEIQKILDAVKPAADRVAAAHAQLEQAIVALLTPEQKASGCVPMAADFGAPPAKKP